MNTKNNQTNAAKNHGKLPVWNLNDLYNSHNDKSLIRDLNDIKKNTQKFEKKYFNKVNALSADNLHKAIKLLPEVERHLRIIVEKGKITKAQLQRLHKVV